VVRPEDEITFITTGGIALRTHAHEISRLGRRARGVTVMDLKDGDEIASVAVLSDEPLADEEQAAQDV
jgi:DNA gyrase subunit A